MKTDRDKRLGAALRRLEVPAHRNGFFDGMWAEVEARLAEGGTGASDAALPGVGAPRRRLAWLPWHWTHDGGRRRLRLALVGAVALVLAGAVVLFGLPGSDQVADQPPGVADQLPGSSTAQEPSLPVFNGPEPANAAEVVRIAQRALRSTQTIVADMYTSDSGPIREDRLDKANATRVNPTRVVFCADGSYRMTPIEKLLPAEWAGEVVDVPSLVGTGWAHDYSYDATTGVLRGYDAGFGWPPAMSNVPEDQPAPEPLETYAFVDAWEETGCEPGVGTGGLDAFRGLAYALRADADGKVRTTTLDGRPAWVVSCAVTPKPAHPPDWAEPPWPGEWIERYERLVVTVDKGTGLPVRRQMYVAGKVLEEMLLMNLKVDVQVPESTLTLEFPKGAFLDDEGSIGRRVDHGFRSVALDEVETAIGRAPMVPTLLPRGYELTRAAVKQQDTFSDEEHGEFEKDSYWYMNKAQTGRAIVALRYGRGFEALAISTRVLDPDVTSEQFSIDTDPFIGRRWPGSLDARTAIELTSGVFDGGKGFVVVAPLTVPHLWAVKDGVLLMVGGDASAEQLLAIANSIQERESQSQEEGSQ
jgi:hypothetical protein